MSARLRIESNRRNTRRTGHRVGPPSWWGEGPLDVDKSSPRERGRLDRWRSGFGHARRDGPGLALRSSGIFYVGDLRGLSIGRQPARSRGARTVIDSQSVKTAEAADAGTEAATRLVDAGYDRPRARGAMKMANCCAPHAASLRRREACATAFGSPSRSCAKACPFHLFHRASQRRLGLPARTSF